MDSVPLPKNPSRQRIVQVCACRSEPRDGRMEYLMPAKRVLAVALTLLLAVSFAAPSGARALAEYGFTYTQSGGEATVTGCDGACPTTLNIPAVLGGYFVTTIGYFAFVSSDLTTVTIPSTVTSIGEGAFYNNNLTTATIPNSVTSIGNYAFRRNLLTTVTIGNSVTSIGNYAFEWNSLATVTIPNSVTTIGEGAFSDNVLTSVTIPNSVTTIGTLVFSTNNLSSVTIPDSVIVIGAGAFQGNSLTSVTIPNSVTTIGAGAFFNNLLTSVTIPNSVTTIGVSAFEINRLTSVTIGNSVTSIGNIAFYANFLTSVTFLGNAPTDGGEVFNANSGLASITRPYTATGWGSTWSGVPVVIGDARATATVKPTASGTATVGRTLTAGGTWAGYPTPTLRYQWYVCTRAVTAARSTVPSTCKRITGATRSTYKLTAAQRGKYVAVLVTGTSLRTTATTWLSKTTTKIR